MAERFIQRFTYFYDLKQEQMKPLIEIIRVTDHDAMMFFAKHELLDEKYMKKHRTAQIMAQAQNKISTADQRKEVKTGKEREELETKTYALTYYNPETDTEEVLTTTSDIKITDNIQKSVEESTGLQSGYSIYSFITTPLMIKVIDERLLKEILDEREYGTPPKFSGATAVRVSDERTRAKIIAVHNAERSKDALVESMRRKDLVEAKIDQEIIMLEETVNLIRKDEEKPDLALRRLGPLTRARFLVALRKKKLSNEVIVLLLEKDIRFLKEIKGKLKGMTLGALLSLVNSMRDLQR